MRQFVLPQPPGETGRLILSGADFHYLARVRRLRAGDTFAGRDRSGTVYDVSVTRVYHDHLEIQARPPAGRGAGRAQAAPEESLTRRLVLAVGLPKGRLFDQIVRQSTEVGVSCIIPLTTEHTVVQVFQERVTAKVERWQRIAEEAVQQCGAARVPEIVAPSTVTGVVERFSGAGLVAFHQEPVASEPLPRYLGGAQRELVLLIGPEGGFSDGEITYLQQNGAVIAHLGSLVLRVETAVVYAVATVNTILRGLESTTCPEQS